MTNNTRRKAATTDAVALASAETGHRPPQAPEVEEAVIGAMLVDPESVYQAIGNLRGKSFYDPRMRILFETMEALYKEHVAIDMTTVTERLRRSGTLKEIGGAAAVARLTQNVASGANVEYYVRILIQKTIQRDLIEAGYAILRSAFDEGCDVDRLINDSQDSVHKAVQGNLRQSWVDIGNALNRSLERLQKMQSVNGLTGVPSGFPSLDAITMGWQRSNLIVIGARPGHGKSAIALNMARAAAVDHGIPAAYFTLEMADIELADRMIAGVSGLPSDKLKGRSKMKQEDWVQLEGALTKVSGAPLYIDETSALTITEFTSKLKRMVHEKGIGIAFVDYLQLMQASSGSNAQYREQVISEVSRQLKATAKELHIPIVAMAQLNRNLMTRQSSSNGRPVLSDLRDSGSIEQDADIVVFIHRPGLLGLSEDPNASRVAELIIAKHRAGRLGIINMEFIEDRVTFVESDRQAYTPPPMPQGGPGVDITPTEGYSPFDFEHPRTF